MVCLVLRTPAQRTPAKVLDRSPWLSVEEGQESPATSYRVVQLRDLLSTARGVRRSWVSLGAHVSVPPSKVLDTVLSGVGKSWGPVGCYCLKLNGSLFPFDCLILHGLSLFAELTQSPIVRILRKCCCLVPPALLDPGKCRPSLETMLRQ